MRNRCLTPSWVLAALLGLGSAAFLFGRLCREARAGELAASQEKVLPRPDRAATVTIGRRGELRVAGKQFLPIFVWLQPISNFDFLKSLGINTLMGEGAGGESARAYLDALQSRGLWGIVHAQPENYPLKKHPALLAWMFGDEPDLPAREPPRDPATTAPAPPPRPRAEPSEIARQYALVKQADASHPVYLNLTSGFFPQFARYDDETYRGYCRATDIVGYDLYPVTGWGRPEWVPLIHPVTRKLRDLAPPSRPVWAILECTTKLQWVSQARLNQIGHPRGATAAELRAMVWMALLGGAKAIGYFPHRWEPYKQCDISEELQAEMKRTNRQLRELSPIILGPDAAGRVTVEHSEGGPVQFTVKKAEGGSDPHLFLVNTSTAPARVRLRVSGTQTLRDIDTGRMMPLDAGGVVLSFKPLEVRLFALAPERGKRSARATQGRHEEEQMDRSEAPPRKVIVGTAMYAMWGEYPGVEKRLDALGEIIDEMARKAAERYPGSGLDLVVLPEDAVCGGRNGSAAERSVSLEGPVLEKMAAMARRHGTYLVVPLFMLENREKSLYTNAAALLDRTGKVAGIYRKVHPVAAQSSAVLEDGVAPGQEFPLFECDFGRVGIQICFDIEFDDGWETLARKGAEIVVWPSQSPQTVRPAAYAMRHRYFVVSSTWRNNAAIFEPTGMRAAQILPPERVLVQQIDLSSMILPWQPALRNGEAMREKYGDKVGYHYSEAEDRGLFWSNDPRMPIGRMVRDMGLETLDIALERNRKLQDALRGGASRQR
jgi:predicted amidohydrolase